MLGVLPDQRLEGYPFLCDVWNMLYVAKCYACNAFTTIVQFSAIIEYFFPARVVNL